MLVSTPPGWFSPIVRLFGFDYPAWMKDCQREMICERRMPDTRPRARESLTLGVVNFRMAAIPSVAMDVYNDICSRHDLIYFCQLSVLKRLVNCPYQDPLSVVMERACDLGNFNASLFATEGIASVKLLWAPVAAFVCGLVIACGNRLSAGLPARFILVSGAIVPQVLLNVPLTTVLLTRGTGLLFLLWYVTLRAIFGPAPVTQPAAPAVWRQPERTFGSPLTSQIRPNITPRRRNGRRGRGFLRRARPAQLWPARLSLVFGRGPRFILFGKHPRVKATQRFGCRAF